MAIRLKPLDQQVIVITEASSGIGLCTALNAAARGAKAVVAARSREALLRVRKRIETMGGEAMLIVADAGHRTQVQAIAEAAIGRFGRIDTWVNNAGLGLYGRLDEVSEDDSRRLFDANFWGVVNGSLVALPYLRAQGGALINVGSEVSDAVVPLMGMYATTKHAVKGFTDALRVEIEEIDQAPVSITLIQPTAVDTPFPERARNYMPHEPKLSTPMIEPQKVADAVLEAATSHQRDVKVGAVAVMNTLVAKIVPSLGDAMAAKQVDRQQRDEAPRHPAGTLHAPVRAGRIKGSGDDAEAPTR